MAARWRPWLLLAALALGGADDPGAGTNRYCASELGQYDDACAASARPPPRK